MICTSVTNCSVAIHLAHLHDVDTCVYVITFTYMYVHVCIELLGAQPTEL
jgi:hypothetical protein